MLTSQTAIITETVTTIHVTSASQSSSEIISDTISVTSSVDVVFSASFTSTYPTISTLSSTISSSTVQPTTSISSPLASESTIPRNEDPNAPATTGGLSSSAVVGIVVGSIAFFIILGASGMLYWRRLHNADKDPLPEMLIEPYNQELNPTRMIYRKGDQANASQRAELQMVYHHDSGWRPSYPGNSPRSGGSFVDVPPQYDNAV
ncbi:hypothetical protein VNI00_014096 [Paramarasmius palmivorus]|uniref:Uncharacterized protein n=1 Tax=Paramarasmius palmivorus TaxID=297713 RepID=A0AAW0BVZ2_9AGAR